MNHNYFPYGFLIWMFIKFLTDKSKEVPEVDAQRELALPEHEMKIKHLSNGRSLNVTAFRYYLHMLDLEVTPNITDEIIETGAYKRYQLINKLNYEEEWPISTRDVKAARAYLLDRWTYMKSLN
ncbi:MAG: hypothetical protein FGM46_02895 [Ferruginibacter sp.]|nr:hypothetical protein [Ferruginibacter sp.]